MTDPLLALRGFGLAFGDQVILEKITFDLPPIGMTVLVGPAGSGKSTLLRTLSGLNRGHTSLITWGAVTFEGEPQGSRGRGEQRARPMLVMQHARFFLDTVRENLVSALPNRSAMSQAEQTRIACARLTSSGLGELVEHLNVDVVSLPISLQRRLAIVRALVTEPRALFVDEPTAGLETSDAVEIISMLRMQATQRSVLLVTHNQRHALAAGGTTMLLAGGCIQEITETRTFFTAPRTPLGQAFVRTGGCSIPGADPTEEVIPASSPRPDAAPTTAANPSRFLGPRGFFWVEAGRLGGCPRPGIIDRLEHDIEGLSRLGISVLVTLEEECLVPRHHLATRAIELEHFPIVDMEAPPLEPALALCRRVDGWLRDGRTVAFHCRAGLGRTGTMLACQRIWSGKTARDAIDEIRSINPRCIQSEVQVSFLKTFETAVHNPTSFQTKEIKRWHSTRC